MQENPLIDKFIFAPSLEMEYEVVIGMFSSDHDSSCCEWHELDFDSTKLDFETAKHFLSKVDKIEVTWVEGMGINIRMYDWEKEYCIFVPWRGSNNWYYGDNIELTISLPNWEKRTYDCTSYQNY